MTKLPFYPAVLAAAALSVAGLTLPVLAGESCGTDSHETQYIAADTPATQPSKSAEEMIEEIKNVSLGPFDRSKQNDESYVQSYIAARNEAVAKQAKLAEAFADAYPDHAMAADMLMGAAQMTQDPAHATELYRRIAAKYPDSEAAQAAAGQIKRADAVGKPFEISFTDAVSGEKVTSESLKGKVVVVDFWATWCPPCVADLPEMKRIYAEYKDKGVQFVGVSLDAPEAQGGKDKLMSFVKQNEVSWPQYYQGNGWQSEFSSSWGINSIPALFVVDADGKLVSTEARGELEELLPKLIARRDGTKAGEKAQTAGGESSGGM